MKENILSCSLMILQEWFWVSFMAKKFEVFSIFKKFKVFVENKVDLVSRP